MDSRPRKFYKFLFFLYLGLLLWVLFNRNRYVAGTPYWDQVHQYLNLHPFKTISLYWRLLADPIRPILTKLAIYNLAGNIRLFLPMGALIPTIWKQFRHLWKTLLLVALLVSAAEIIQVLILAGSCDVDDLILNLVGTALGYPLYHILTK